MNRKLLIGIGVVLILLLAGVWTYLLVFGTPSSLEEVYTDFGFTPGDDANIPVPTTPDPVNEPVVEIPATTVDTTGLAQLTTRSVAGYQMLNTASDTVRYVEEGTGHIYDINLRTGKETVVSKTTVPQAHRAFFTPGGSLVVMRSHYFNTSELILGKIGTSSTDLKISSVDQLVGVSVDDYYIGDSEELLYTSKNARGITGYNLELTTLTQHQLFQVPLRDGIIRWGNSANETHYIQTKPSYDLPGYLYQIGTTLTALSVDGYGLVAAPLNKHILYSTVVDNFYTGYSYNIDSQSTQNLPVSVYPEKCAASTLVSDEVYCASQISDDNKNLPDSWYQGTRSYSDGLWVVSVNQSKATLLVDIEASSGREVDVTNLTTTTNDDRLFFLNKHNNTLWTYAP